MDGMPDPRLVVLIGAVLITAICAVGLTTVITSMNNSEVDNTTLVADNGMVAENTSGNDADVLQDIVAILPEGTPVGLLDRQDVAIEDGLVSTIVTTDGSGKVEYGISVVGAAADQISENELSVVTASGLEFTPTQIYREGDRVSTTINAEHGAERWVILRWVDDGVVKFLLHNGWAE
jgi:hypothetical protein